MQRNIKKKLLGCRRVDQRGNIRKEGFLESTVL